MVFLSNIDFVLNLGFKLNQNQDFIHKFIIMRILNFLMILLVVVFLDSCKTNTELVPRNMALLYNPIQSSVQPEIKVFHTANNTTKVYVRLSKKDLGFEVNSKGERQARVDIYAKLFKGMNMSFLQDSIRKEYLLIESEISDFIEYIFEFETSDDKKYYLQIETRDLVKNARSEYFKEINKDNFWSYDDFSIINKKDKSLVFSPFLHKNENYEIKTEYFSPTNALMFYIEDKIPLALPPFYLKPIPDLQIKALDLEVLDYNNAFNLVLKKPGIYHLQQDSSVKKGLTLYYFDEFYPKLGSSENLAKSLRYMLSKKEYEKIIEASDVKSAVDSFWLSHSTDVTQASILIREYYGRVQRANIYFSSFTEGWRTDRGMIYTVLGPPTNVFKYKDKEVWRYGSRMSLDNTELIFWKIDNPFSNEHYLLERKINYKPLWYGAVDTWRKGIIYRFTN